MADKGAVRKVASDLVHKADTEIMNKLCSRRKINASLKLTHLAVHCLG